MVICLRSLLQTIQRLFILQESTMLGVMKPWVETFPSFPLTFSPKGEIIRNLPSLLYTQVFIVAITLGHSM